MQEELNKKPVLVVVGGQFGSESKGLVASRLCLDREVNYAVRTGAVNAGHTVYYNGKKYVNQQLPVGWVNPNTVLVIGAGAYVHPEILEKEVNMITEATGVSPIGRILIDKNAGLHSDKHHKAESGLHERMGSTGEGCGEAVKDKINRSFEYRLFSQILESEKYNIADTSLILNEAYDKGEQILLEGTQGTLLDLHFGYYPFVTGRQTTASAWATEAGLSPSLMYEVVMVCRTMPIRVAGNSGPLDNETSWVKLARRINEAMAFYGQAPIVHDDVIEGFEKMEKTVMTELGMPLIDAESYSSEWRTQFSSELSNLHKLTFERLSEHSQNELRHLFEFTTVTKKLRRVADWSKTDMRKAVVLNRPSGLAINFLNYLYPTCWGVKTWEDLQRSFEFDNIMKYLRDLKAEYGVPIAYVNCAPDCIIAVPQEEQIAQ